MSALLEELKRLYPQALFSRDPISGVIDFQTPSGDRSSDAMIAPIGNMHRILLWAFNEGILAP